MANGKKNSTFHVAHSISVSKASGFETQSQFMSPLLIMAQKAMIEEWRPKIIEYNYKTVFCSDND